MWKHLQELRQPTGYGVYRPGAGLHSPYFDSSLPVFCRLQRITGYRENYKFYKLEKLANYRPVAV